LWRKQILQPVFAEVAQREPIGKFGRHHRARRFGEQHLSAVAGAHHPGSPVYVQAGVQPPADQRLAGVDPDPYADRLTLPAVVGERTLGLRGGPHRRARIGEGEVKRVSLHLHLHAAVPAHRLAQQASVVFERPHVPVGAELLQ
jgi:hypothetical protein